MAKVVIYTTANCPYCEMAKDLFRARKTNFEEIRIDLDDQKRDEMIRLSHRRSVPQIFINDLPVGGFDDLSGLAKSGKLDSLLNK